MSFLVAVLLVGGSIHQPIQIGSVTDFHLDEPSVAFGIGVDHSWIVAQIVVDFDYFSRERSIDIGGSLHGFDATKAVALVELVVHFWQIHKDDIPKRRLGKIGNPNRADGAFHLDIFVG